jgi:hypothetical protein
MGYHKTKIEKGVIGEFSKIKEEFDELTDAYEQNAKLLQMCELADLVGAIEEYSKNKFGISLNDLILFSNQTKSAFNEGSR